MEEGGRSCLGGADSELWKKQVTEEWSWKEISEGGADVKHRGLPSQRTTQIVLGPWYQLK